MMPNPMMNRVGQVSGHAHTRDRVDGSVEFAIEVTGARVVHETEAPTRDRVIA